MIMVLVLLVVVGSLSGCGAKPAGGEANQDGVEKYIPVEVKAVEKQTLANVITLSGKVYPNKEVMVLPKTPGKVASVNVKVGDKVNKGSVLFVLDGSDVQKQVDQAGAGLSIAEANYQRTKEQIELAKTNLERQNALYEAGVISKAELEQAQLQASDSALVTVEAQVKQAEVSYNQALAALNDMTVTAPVGGYITAVNVEVGEMASNAQPALTVVDMEQVFIEVSVTENSINALAVGQEVKVSIPSAASKPFTGKINNISPAADARTQLYPLKIYLENKEGLIKPGMFAKVNLNTQVKKDILAVLSEAVVLSKGQNVVYVVEEDKAVEKVVKIGMDTGAYVEILEGLTEGEQVIIKGQTYVQNGSIVKVVGGKEA